jgi:hypothetical protein
MIKRAVALTTLAVAVTLGAGPAGALNKTTAGGSVRRCVHWVNTINDRGWPIEYCDRWR